MEPKKFKNRKFHEILTRGRGRRGAGMKSTSAFYYLCIENNLHILYIVFVLECIVLIRCNLMSFLSCLFIIDLSV